MRDALHEAGYGSAALASEPANAVRAPAATRGTEALDAVLADFGIIIVPTSRRRRSGETHARGALREVLRDNGADHLRRVLRLIRGTEPNRETLWSEVFLALSDCLETEPGWQAREEELRAALDEIDLERLRQKAVNLRPWPVRQSLRAALWNALDEALGVTSTSIPSTTGRC